MANFRKRIQRLRELGHELDRAFREGGAVPQKSAKMQSGGKVPGVVEILTGVSQERLQDLAALGYAPGYEKPGAVSAENIDKAVHSLATRLTAERFGKPAAVGLGVGREVLQGLGQLLRGRPGVSSIIGKEGFDIEDIQANLRGLRGSRRAFPRENPRGQGSLIRGQHGGLIPPSGLSPDPDPMRKQVRTPRGSVMARRLAPFQSFIAAASEEHRVPEPIIRAIIAVESSGRPKAEMIEKNVKDISRGLMQIRKQTAAYLGYDPAQLYDPQVNINAGTDYLARQYKRYGNWTDAVAAYNAGSVRKKQGQYSNQGYVDKIMRALKEQAQ